MSKPWRIFVLVFLGMLACSPHKIARAQTLSIIHPDSPSKTVEYFLEKPQGSGPWPVIVFLHGHQDWPAAGGKDFVKWGVLDEFADRGYLAVAISQPGYGNSSGPADFCGPFTQHAVTAVIAKLRSDGYVNGNKIVIEGVSRGAMVAGLVAARDPSIGGIVLISGLYDLPEFARAPQSEVQRSIVSAMKKETDGSDVALRARSLLFFAQDIKAATLILNGAKDDRTDPNQARRMAELINRHGGHAQSIVYPYYGHQIPVDVRSKDVDPFIERLLNK